MKSNNKPNKIESYKNLHYSYFNPFSSLNKYCNRNKRQRIKDKYSDIAMEKRDYIIYEISQKDIDKLNSQSTIDKTKSLYSKSFNNSQILKSEKIYYNLERMGHNNKRKKNEIKKLGIQPNSIIYRSQSAIINKKNNFDKNKIFNNSNKSITKKICQKKLNLLESYKMENNTKIIFDEKNSSLSSTIKELTNLNIQENNNKHEENKNKNNNNNESLQKSENISYDKDKNKNNIINNNKKIDNNKNIFGKKNIYEENKNYENNNINKRKKNNSIKLMNSIIENNNNNTFKIQPNKNNYKINNLKNKSFKKSISCPSIIYKNKKVKDIKISNDFLEIENYLLKENIHKILKNNKKYNNNLKNSIFIKDEEYNDNKLKKLLLKVPKHNEKEGLKNYPDFIIISKEKNINLIEKYGSLQNVKNIMPPNNLEDILFQNQIDFFNNNN